VHNNRIYNIDPFGLAVGSFLICESINAGYSVNSFRNTLKDLNESTELLNDMLSRVNKEIEQCPKDDIRRLSGLQELRRELSIAVTEATLSNSIGNSISLIDISAGTIRAGVCGLSLLIPGF